VLLFIARIFVRIKLKAQELGVDVMQYVKSRERLIARGLFHFVHLFMLTSVYSTGRVNIPSARTISVLLSEMPP
jgi:hypothetical protein